jgi:hypothetical protein
MGTPVFSSGCLPAIDTPINVVTGVGMAIDGVIKQFFRGFPPPRND